MSKMTVGATLHPTNGDIYTIDIPEVTCRHNAHDAPIKRIQVHCAWKRQSVIVGRSLTVDKRDWHSNWQMVI